MFSEDDDEYAPSYMLLPSGGKANRILFMGVLSKKEEKENGGFSCKINDSTGNFSVYAGQYQPEAADALRDIESPSYVACVGKPDTFETDEGDIISTVRPERIVEVDEPSHYRWIAETAEKTLDRLRLPDDDTYVEMALEEYGESVRNRIQDSVIEALEFLDEKSSEHEVDTDAEDAEDAEEAEA